MPPVLHSVSGMSFGAGIVLDIREVLPDRQLASFGRPSWPCEFLRDPWRADILVNQKTDVKVVNAVEMRWKLCYGIKEEKESRYSR